MGLFEDSSPEEIIKRYKPKEIKLNNLVSDIDKWINENITSEDIKYHLQDKVANACLDTITSSVNSIIAEESGEAEGNEYGAEIEIDGFELIKPGIKVRRIELYSGDLTIEGEIFIDIKFQFSLEGYRFNEELLGWQTYSRYANIGIEIKNGGDPENDEWYFI